MHTGFIGMSRSGKTTLAKVFARELVQRGRRVVVLDPIGDPAWRTWCKVDHLTADAHQFLAIAKANECIHLFVDEWGTAVGKYAPEFDWLGTTSRHHGHTVWLVAHRWQQISTTLRDNIGQGFLFGQGVKSAALVAEEFGRPELASSLLQLPRGKFIQAVRCEADSRAGTIDFATKKVKLKKATTPAAA